MKSWRKFLYIQTGPPEVAEWLLNAGIRKLLLAAALGAIKAAPLPHKLDQLLWWVIIGLLIIGGADFTRGEAIYHKSGIDIDMRLLEFRDRRLEERLQRRKRAPKK